MISVKRIEEIIEIVLLIGILVSGFLVFLGGALYLMDYGSQTLQSELAETHIYQTSIKHVWYMNLSLTSLGIIELGLIVLVITQTLRVALLCGFYIITRDYWFTLMGCFILLILLYSLVWRD